MNAWKKRTLVWVALLAGSCAPVLGDAISSVVPNDCLLLVQLQPGRELAQALGGTAIGRAITSSELGDSGLMMVKGGARFFSTLALGVPYETVRDQYMSNVGLAIFERTQDAGVPVAFLFDVSEDAQKAKKLMLETIMPRMVAINKKKMSRTEQSYGGVTIHRFQEKRKKPSYWAFVGEVLVVGNEAGTKKIIDGGQDLSQTLDAHEPFRTTHDAVAVDGGGVTYINVQRLVDRARPRFETHPKDRQGMAATGVLAMKAAAVSMEVAGDGIRTRLSVYTGEETMGFLRLAAPEPAASYAAQKLVPDDHHVCVAAKLPSGEALLKAFQGFIGDMAGQQKLDEMAQFAAGIEQQAGIEWQGDFVDALDGELFFAMRLPNFAEMAVAQRKPTMQELAIMIGMPLRDESAVASTLDRLFKSEFAVNAGFAPSVQAYKGRQLAVISLPNNNAVFPCYTFEGNCLVFALAPETLERFVDRVSDSRVLSSSEDFRKSYNKVSGQGNVMGYADVSDILGMLVQIIEAKAPPALHSLVPELKRVTDGLPGMALSIKGDGNGLSGQSYGPVGGLFTFTTLVSVGTLSKKK